MISWDWFTHYDTSLWLIIQHCFIAFLCFFFSNKSWAYLFVLYSPLLFILETFNFSLIVFPHGPRFHISAFNEHPNLLSTRGLRYYYQKLLFFRLFLAVFLQHKLLLSDVSSVFALPSLALIGIHSVSPDELFDYSVFFYLSPVHQYMGWEFCTSDLLVKTYFMAFELYSVLPCYHPFVQHVSSS